ncbi:hypothetical protein VTI28DRAFT_6156 [Corynascus sepedonium]
MVFLEASLFLRNPSCVSLKHKRNGAFHAQCSASPVCKLHPSLRSPIVCRKKPSIQRFTSCYSVTTFLSGCRIPKPSIKRWLAQPGWNLHTLPIGNPGAEAQPISVPPSGFQFRASCLNPLSERRPPSSEADSSGREDPHRPPKQR